MTEPQDTSHLTTPEENPMTEDNLPARVGPAPGAPLVTISWGTVMGVTQTGYDDETEQPEFEEETLRDAVVGVVASGVSARLQRDMGKLREDALAETNRIIQKTRAEVTRAEITTLVREALTGEIRITDRYGEATGEATTLRELIRADIAAYLAEPAQRSSYDERKGGFRELLRTQVVEYMTKDLKSVVEEARRTVRTAVEAQAAKFIATLVEKATGTGRVD